LEFFAIKSTTQKLIAMFSGLVVLSLIHQHIHIYI